MSESEIIASSHTKSLQIDRKKLALFFASYFTGGALLIVYNAYKTEMEISMIAAYVALLTISLLVLTGCYAFLLLKILCSKHPFCVINEGGTVIFSSYSSYLKKAQGFYVPQKHLKMKNGKIGEDVFIKKAYFFSNTQSAKLLEIGDAATIEKLAEFFWINNNFGFDLWDNSRGKKRWTKSPVLVIENFSQKYPFSKM